MEQNKETIQKLETVYKQIEEKLEEGVTYYSTPIVNEYGTSGGSVFTIENGQRVYVDREQFGRLDLFNVTRQFPVYAIVKYTIKKGAPITVEGCSPEMLIEEMHFGVKEEKRKIAERNRLLELSNRDLVKIETTVKFLKKKKLTLDVMEKQTEADGSVDETDYSCLEDEIKALYQAVDGKIKKMHVTFENDVLVVKTTPAIPGLTTELDEKKEVYTLDASNLEAIYAFMESHDEGKMAKAVEVLHSNPALLEKAEKRYLHFVRARLNNAAATLAEFSEAALRKSEVNTLLGKHFAKDFISLSYFDDSESKLVVDFIGSMVQNAIDVETYIAQAIQLADVKELIALYDTYAEKAKGAILAETKVYAEGWYAQISSHLIKLKLKRILFEKTQFDEANRSLALKAFVFFLNINCAHSVYLDVFQSDEPKMTEMFWLLKAVPDSSWGDTDLTIPDSPLKFQRTASYKIGDEGDWESISKP